MNIRRINDQISVSEQITPGDVSAIVAAGFQTVINNRPDGESPNQPTRAAIRAEVEKAGLRFVDIPFTSGRQSADDVAAFAATLADSAGPVFAYCRTGTRSATIWAMSQAGRLPVEQILAEAGSAGYDLSPLRPALQAMAR